MTLFSLLSGDHTLGVTDHILGIVAELDGLKSRVGSAVVGILPRLELQARVVAVVSSDPGARDGETDAFRGLKKGLSFCILARCPVGLCFS